MYMLRILLVVKNILGQIILLRKCFEIKNTEGVKAIEKISSPVLVEDFFIAIFSLPILLIIQFTVGLHEYASEWKLFEKVLSFC